MICKITKCVCADQRADGALHAFFITQRPSVMRTNAGVRPCYVPLTASQDKQIWSDVQMCQQAAHLSTSQHRMRSTTQGKSSVKQGRDCLELMMTKQEQSRKYVGEM